MNNSENGILSEILLELTLAIGSESAYKKIIKKTVSLWLRRLSCTIGGIVIREGDNLQTVHVIPTYLKRKPIPRPLYKYLKNEKSDIYTEIPLENEEYLYIYPIGDNRFFLFQRQKPLSKAQCSELYPVTQFFATALDNVQERDKRRQIEQELDTEKRILRTVIDLIPDAVYLKNDKLEKIITNKADVINAGFESQEDLLGKRDEDIYPEKIAQDYKGIDQYILNTGQPIEDREEKLINKEGKEAWILSSKFAYKNAQDEIIGIVGIGRDITKRKEVSEKLKRLSLVASQTTNGVIITNLVGEVVWINEGFTRLTGYNLTEMVGKKPGSVLQGKESDPKTIKKMSESLKSREPFEVDITNYKKDGTPYIIKVTCNPLRDESGQVKGFMAIESDITEMTRFREELVQAKQIAEKAQEAEKTFLTNMSHEIRTPLNAIIGMASLLKTTQTNAEQKDYIDTLDESSRFLLRLISDILDLSKIEAGKIEVKKSDFDLIKLLKTIQQTFLLKAKAKGVKVKLMIDSSIPQCIYGDEVLFQQVLNNLISNAEKFTEKGSVKIIVELDDDQKNLVFQIQDTGRGISQKDQEQLFQKFKQADNSQTNEKGTGLGLCITKEIVELLGGQIMLESTLGQGTTFSFLIPYEKTRNSILQKVVNKMPQGYPINTTKKILIVEDNLINQKYITRLMEKLHIEYDVANNGKEALEKSKDNEYGLIFMDIQMPILDGYEATKMIRSSANKNKQTPIIALTASAMLDQKNKALDLGMNDFLTKPFTPEQLKEKLQIAI